jgi:excinuclease UvrABC ATPase subunit
MGSPFGNIEVRGARENNLKNISLDIPRRQITVFTGVSGSGKSSLVFDTVAAESQRLLNETFSTFVQNFLPRYGQPDLDVLANLSTAIIVDQQRLGGNSRSTIGNGDRHLHVAARLVFSSWEAHGSARFGAFIQRSHRAGPCERFRTSTSSCTKL